MVAGKSIETGMQVKSTTDVRTDDPRPMGSSQSRNGLLPDPSSLHGFPKPGRDDSDPFNSFFATVLNDPFHRSLRDGEHSQIDGIGNRLNVRIGTDAVDRNGLMIHRINLSRV